MILAAGLIAGAPALLLFVLTWPAVAMSAFLGYGLIVNHRQCRICWAGHVANAVLFVGLGFLAVTALVVDAVAFLAVRGPVPASSRVRAPALPALASLAPLARSAEPLGSAFSQRPVHRAASSARRS